MWKNVTKLMRKKKTTRDRIMSTDCESIATQQLVSTSLGYQPTINSKSSHLPTNSGVNYKGHVSFISTPNYYMKDSSGIRASNDDVALPYNPMYHQHDQFASKLAQNELYKWTLGHNASLGNRNSSYPKDITPKNAEAATSNGTEESSFYNESLNKDAIQLGNRMIATDDLHSLKRQHPDYYSEGSKNHLSGQSTEFVAKVVPNLSPKRSRTDESEELLASKKVKLEAPAEPSPSGSPDAAKVDQGSNPDSELRNTNERLNANEGKFICRSCTFETFSEDDYITHCSRCVHHNDPSLTVTNSVSDGGQAFDSMGDKEGISAPKVNSQGKIKTFRCKRCGFHTTVKNNFWAHARTHMKEEKILICTKCPFVTEYKHHLEYHDRNHKGDKPFQCSTCPYNCVNKSMLISHMKSHSSVYQYSCKNCNYATKYCHSLKLHLRKYNHQASVVLNPDGTPNPLPIIDVYGTRRGPKIKKDENGMPIFPPQYQLQADLLKNQMEITGTLPPAPVPLQDNLIMGQLQSPAPLFPHVPPTQVPAIERFYQDLLQNDYNLASRNDESIIRNSPPRTLPMDTDLMQSPSGYSQTTYPAGLFPRKDLLHSTPDNPRDNRFRRRSNSDGESTPYKSLRAEESDVNQIADRAMPSLFFNQFLSQPALLSQPMLSQYHQLIAQSHIARQIQNAIQQIRSEEPNEKRDIRGVEVSRSRPETPEAGETSILGTALDLTKDQTTIDLINQVRTPIHNDSPPSSTVSPPTSDISTPPTKNRRKGKAFKIDKIALRLGGSDDGGTNMEENAPTTSDQSFRTDQMPSKDDSTEISDVSPKSPNWDKANYCKFCSIAFMSDLMYNMHMGYHGYEDPFLCNRCGQKCADEVSFSMHLTRAEHV